MFIKKPAVSNSWGKDMEQRTDMGMFPDEVEELSLLDILIVLAEQKKLIAAVTALFALAGLAYALLFTKPEYKSEIQMMTVNSRIVGDGELSVYLPGNMIDAVVSSNAMRDAVIVEFSLTEKDGKTISRDAALKELSKNVSVDIGKNGLVTISVKSPSPERSMKMADYIYRRTAETLLAMGVTSTIETRDTFLEKTIKDKLNEIDGNAALDQNSKISSILELYSVLSQYNENQRIKDKNPMVLQLVSPASMPDEKEPQGRGKIVVLATLLGFFCAVTAAFLRHFWTAPGDQETSEKKNYLRKLLGFKTRA